MVTKYIETRVTNRSNGLPYKIKSGQGIGSPIGDVKMENEKFQPVGSDYFDKDSGTSYIRVTAGWSEIQGGGGTIAPATDTVTGGLIQKYDANSNTLVINFTDTPIT
jgi:hypothetical protein